MAINGNKIDKEYIGRYIYDKVLYELFNKIDDKERTKLVLRGINISPTESAKAISTFAIKSYEKYSDEFAVTMPQPVFQEHMYQVIDKLIFLAKKCNIYHAEGRGGYIHKGINGSITEYSLRVIKLQELMSLNTAKLLVVSKMALNRSVNSFNQDEIICAIFGQVFV